ncbi:MAG TPA: DUF5985 family protein [Usitatibacter sp.]|nr:DUF5985 family protein [Usitatibacter sp.]
MAQTIYSLCALTCLLCTWLLLSAYARTRFRLLFWSGLCFAGLTVNNVLLVLDKVVFTEVDLTTPRLATALAALLLLLVGLIWERD